MDEHQLPRAAWTRGPWRRYSLKKAGTDGTDGTDGTAGTGEVPRRNTRDEEFRRLCGRSRLGTCHAAPCLALVLRRKQYSAIRRKCSAAEKTRSCIQFYGFLRALSFICSARGF